MNKAGQENRSVRNTKRRLREGLLKLMEEKPINEISVKELTDLVDVNRGTFYFHYQDIYDLLRAMEDEFFVQFDRTLTEHKPFSDPGKDAGTGTAVSPYLHAIFSFLYENRSFCRIMLSPHGDMQFVDRVKTRVDDQCRYFWQILAPGADELRYGMYNAFIINGCIGIIQKWLDEPEHSGPEEISQLAATIILASVRPVIA